MSYHFIIYYTRSNRFPDPARLAAELSSRAPGLSLPSSIDLRVARGFIPIASTGFEVTRSPITSAQIEDHREALKEAGEADDDHVAVLQASDTRTTFRCKDDKEISAARIVAGAVATLSGGYLSDPQQDITVQGGYLTEQALVDRIPSS
jgi:hypothetical protein